MAVAFTGSIIEAPEIPVRYVAGDGVSPIPDQAPIAFEQLEASLGSVRGRKFYGVVQQGEYRACVAIRSDEPSDQSEPDESLPLFHIPGGRYFCRRLEDFLPDNGRIGQLVEKLINRSDFDSSRPVIEFYRSHNELTVRVPVK